MWLRWHLSCLRIEIHLPPSLRPLVQLFRLLRRWHRLAPHPRRVDHCFAAVEHPAIALWDRLIDLGKVVQIEPHRQNFASIQIARFVFALSAIDPLQNFPLRQIENLTPLTIFPRSPTDPDSLLTAQTLQARPFDPIRRIARCLSLIHI